MQINKSLLASGLLTATFFSTTAMAETRNFDFQPFDKINVSAGITVALVHGESQNVSVEALSDSDFEHLELSMTDGTLHASQDYNLLDFILGGGIFGGFFNQSPQLKVYITLPSLKNIQASSGAQVTIDNITGESLAANASSGANIDLNDITFKSISLSASSGAQINALGLCTTINANASSGADIYTASLICKIGDASASSGGYVNLYAEDSLKANASSGGNISVEGTPEQVDANSSSGGDVRIRQ